MKKTGLLEAQIISLICNWVVGSPKYDFDLNRALSEDQNTDVNLSLRDVECAKYEFDGDMGYQRPKTRVLFIDEVVGGPNHGFCMKQSRWRPKTHILFIDGAIRGLKYRFSSLIRMPNAQNIDFLEIRSSQMFKE